MVADALSRKQEDLTSAKEKIQASRQGRLIDPAMIGCMEKDPRLEGFLLINEILKRNRNDDGNAEFRAAAA